MLSIIIPIYNAEEYIAECVESILGQSYEDIEVILVDNMSTDSSKSICQNFVNADTRVKFFHEQKRGAAAARNRGIKEASGEFVTFVDSDDYVSSYSYELIIDKMSEQNADLACFSFYCVDEKGINLNWYEPKLVRYRSQKYSGKDVAKLFLTSLDIEGFCWNKVFKRKLLIHNNFLFEEDKTAFEDMAIIFDIICKCSRVILIPEKLYYYRQVSFSLTHKYYDRKYIEYYDSMKHIMNTAKDYSLYLESYVFMISRSIMEKYNIYKNGFNRNDDRNNKIIDFISQQILILLYFRSEKFRTFMKGILLRYYRKYDITKFPEV